MNIIMPTKISVNILKNSPLIYEYIYITEYVLYQQILVKNNYILIMFLGKISIKYL